MMNYAFLLPIMVLGFFGTGGYVKEEGEKTLTFKEGDFLEVDNTNGKIEVEKYTGKELKVQLEKHIKGYSQKKAEKILKRIKIEFHQEKNGITIRTRLPRIQRGDIGVDFHIFVPTKGEFSFNAANGKIEITGIEGKIDIDVANGEVKLENATGDIDVDAANGEIDYSLSSVVDSNRINFNCANGEINISLPEGISPSIYAGAVNGKVSSDFPIFTNKAQVKGAFQIIATAVNGHIRIKQGK